MQGWLSALRSSPPSVPRPLQTALGSAREKATHRMPPTYTSNSHQLSETVFHLLRISWKNE